MARFKAKDRDRPRSGVGNRSQTLSGRLHLSASFLDYAQEPMREFANPIPFTTFNCVRLNQVMTNAQCSGPGEDEFGSVMLSDSAGSDQWHVWKW